MTSRSRIPPAAPTLTANTGGRSAGSVWRAASAAPRYPRRRRSARCPPRARRESARARVISAPAKRSGARERSGTRQTRPRAVADAKSCVRYDLETPAASRTGPATMHARFRTGRPRPSDACCVRRRPDRHHDLTCSGGRQQRNRTEQKHDQRQKRRRSNCGKRRVLERGQRCEWPSIRRPDGGDEGQTDQPRQPPRREGREGHGVFFAAIALK